MSQTVYRRFFFRGENSMRNYGAFSLPWRLPLGLVRPPEVCADNNHVPVPVETA